MLEVEEEERENDRHNSLPHRVLIPLPHKLLHRILNQTLTQHIQILRLEVVVDQTRDRDLLDPFRPFAVACFERFLERGEVGLVDGDFVFACGGRVVSNDHRSRKRGDEEEKEGEERKGEESSRTLQRLPVKLHHVLRVRDFVDKVLSKPLRVSDIEKAVAVRSAGVVDLSEGTSLVVGSRRRERRSRRGEKEGRRDERGDG